MVSLLSGAFHCGFRICFRGVVKHGDRTYLGRICMTKCMHYRCFIVHLNVFSSSEAGLCALKSEYNKIYNFESTPVRML
jgi:hypothetical protein